MLWSRVRKNVIETFQEQYVIKTLTQHLQENYPNPNHDSSEQKNSKFHKINKRFPNPTFPWTREWTFNKIVWIHVGIKVVHVVPYSSGNKLILAKKIIFGKNKFYLNSVLFRKQINRMNSVFVPVGWKG